MSPPVQAAKNYTHHRDLKELRFRHDLTANDTSKTAKIATSALARRISRHTPSYDQQVRHKLTQTRHSHSKQLFHGYSFHSVSTGRVKKLHTLLVSLYFSGRWDIGDVKARNGQKFELLAHPVETPWPKWMALRWASSLKLVLQYSDLLRRQPKLENRSSPHRCGHWWHQSANTVTDSVNDVDRCWQMLARSANDDARRWWTTMNVMDDDNTRRSMCIESHIDFCWQWWQKLTTFGSLTSN